MMTLQIFDPGALTRATAEYIADVAERAIGERGRFSLGLSGGSTPRPVYELLAEPPFRDRIDWDRTHIWWGDERCVPPDDAQSNYRLAREALLDKVPLPPANVHRMRGEIDPATAAAEYEQELADYLAEEGAGAGLDLVLLGMGDNGHTASLFPGQPAVHEQERQVVAEYVAEVSMWRITLTAPAINAARFVVILVGGEAKAQRLHEVLDGPYDPDRSPVQLIKPASGELVWMVDRAAASALNRGT
jgi:6-phosphogluconolactonase